MNRLERRIKWSKRWGKIVLTAVLLFSLLLSFVLVQGLLLAVETHRPAPAVRAGLGLLLVVGLDLFSIVLIRRQHRVLDEAREELRDLVSSSEMH